MSKAEVKCELQCYGCFGASFNDCEECPFMNSIEEKASKEKKDGEEKEVL